VCVLIRWPSGLTQSFDHLPVGNRIQIEENSRDVVVKPFSASPASYARAGPSLPSETLPTSVDTWLIEPLRAPDFSLPDLTGKSCELRSFGGAFAFLNFWTTAAPACVEQLRWLERDKSLLESRGLRILSVNVDAQRDVSTLRSFVAGEGLSLSVLVGTEEVANVYNIVYRYLYDRRRDLPLPTSVLLNRDAMIIKLYQGLVDAGRLVEDLTSYVAAPGDRLQRALPFAAKQDHGEFRRNDFTYGVVLLQHGYLDQAATSFKQVIAARPDDAEAFYNLGTLDLRRNNLEEARQSLEKAIRLRPNYPEAWNNLGMIAAQQDQTDEAIRNFQESLRLKSDYSTALLNLGNLYRRRRNVAEAEKLLTRALDLEPDNAEINYSLGMLYGQQGEIPRAFPYFEKALRMRPDYADALNNLGVLMVREKRFDEAEQKFKTCIEAAPNFDQAYLNLARLYVMRQDKQKAESILQALLRQQPQHKIAQKMLGMLR